MPTTTRRRIVTDTVELRIIALGTYGFSGRCIQDQVEKHDHVELSLSTIYHTLSQAGISLWDYRHGETGEAKEEILLIRQGQETKPKRRAAS